MYRKGIIIMSYEEAKRLQYIRKALDGGLSQVRAAEVLGISDRQVRRVVQRVRVEGDGGVVHRLRGKESNRKYGEEFKERVLIAYRRKYEGFGPLLASEKLEEREKIKISDETLRKWLMEAGLWQKGRRKRKHRQWRERKKQYGEMVQMDGSHHDWLEGRGAKLVLMGYSDDATGRVYCRFYPYEGTIPAMDSFKRYVRKYGIPASVYLDKHTTYKSCKKTTIEEELAGKESYSQFERSLHELEVEVIHANSPQAKGRIERLFLTFQDRLIKEMRLRRIKTVAEANEFLEGYLPNYNKRFSVTAQEQGTMHRKIPYGMNIDRILCIKEERTLRNDFTVLYYTKLFQVLEATKAEKVSVEEGLDGTIRLYYKGQSLKYKQIESRPFQRIRKKKEPYIARGSKQWIPPKDHPWRRPFLNSPVRGAAALSTAP